jgi:hypothetical protein
MTFAYRATVPRDVLTGSEVVNTAHLGLQDQAVHFRRSDVVRVGVPDLSRSTLRCWPYPVRPGGVATCALALANVGPGAAPGATAAISLPVGTAIVSGSLGWVGEGTAEATTGTVRWSGPLAAGGSVSLTYQLVAPESLVEWPAYSVAFLEDREGGRWERAEWLRVEPLQQYFPLVFHRGPEPAQGE